MKNLKSPKSLKNGRSVKNGKSMKNGKNKGGKFLLELYDDKRIIGTHRYEMFQKMCSRAGSLAIKEAQAQRLPLTYVEDDKIVKQYANGKREILGRVKPRIIIDRVYKIP